MRSSLLVENRMSSDEFVNFLDSYRLAFGQTKEINQNRIVICWIVKEPFIYTEHSTFKFNAIGRSNTYRSSPYHKLLTSAWFSYHLLELNAKVECLCESVCALICLQSKTKWYWKAENYKYSICVCVCECCINKLVKHFIYPLCLRMHSFGLADSML